MPDNSSRVFFKQASLFLAIILVALVIVQGSAHFSQQKAQISEGAAVREALAAHYVVGVNTGGILVDGRLRTFTVIVPPGSGPFPLVVFLHGRYGLGGEIVSQAGGFQDLANTEGFVLVAPYGVAVNGDISWADGRGATPADLDGVDDVKFMKSLVAHIKSHLPIVASKVYVTGVSNGAMMSYRLGCEVADVFAAIGPVVGNMPEPLATCNPSESISIIAVNGLADTFTPYTGGAADGGGRVLSAPSSLGIFAAKNGCSSPPIIKKPSILINDGTQVEQYTYSPCTAPGTAVVGYAIGGMGHTWPPSASALSTKNLYASKVIWDFFKAHPDD